MPSLSRGAKAGCQGDVGRLSSETHGKVGGDDRGSWKGSLGGQGGEAIWWPPRH